MCRLTGMLALACMLSRPAVALEPGEAGRFATLALDCVHQEYPNKIAHVMSGDEDVAPPRALTPVFYGCFDWHSAVHGHWLLARLARQFPAAPFAATARDALAQNLKAPAVTVETAYMGAAGRASFERPYGLAWLLQLAAELRQWDDDEARAWAATLAPLEQAAAARLAGWIPKLDYPIRTGEHSQTAFAFGLAIDWARSSGHDDMAGMLERRTVELYARDRNCPLAYEPSGQDFLSPCLAEADLMRRVLDAETFAAWLRSFLPVIPTGYKSDWLPVAKVSDRGDGKLAHLDGLNLSRAWMLEGIAAGLPADDRRCAALLETARAHAAAALPAVTGAHYEGGHWLGSFATYLVTRRGIEGTSAGCAGLSQ